MPGTLRIAQPCGCRQESFMGQKRDKLCPCGHLYEKPAVVEARSERRSRPRRRSTEPKRDWTDALAKVEEEGCCRICKTKARKIDAAHVLGREHDEPKVSGATGEILKELYVHPDRIIPACGPFPEGCHGEIHEHQINLVHYLTMDEQLRAVKDAGGIAQAWVLLARVEHREEVEREAKV